MKRYKKISERIKKDCSLNRLTLSCLKNENNVKYIWLISQNLCDKKRDKAYLSIAITINSVLLFNAL